MKRVLFFLLALSFLTEASQAAIIFTLTPPAQVVAPDSVASFELFIRSSEIGGEQVDGLESNTIAGAGDGSSGVFINTPANPTETYLLNQGPVNILDDPGQAFTSDTLVGGMLVGNADVLYARLSLSTVGLAEGAYVLTLDSLAANRPGFGALTTISAGPVSFAVVSAVPEPSTLALFGLVGGATLLRRRFRRTTKN
jgi:hypothetical protein